MSLQNNIEKVEMWIEKINYFWYLLCKHNGEENSIPSCPKLMEEKQKEYTTKEKNSSMSKLINSNIFVMPT